MRRVVVIAAIALAACAAGGNDDAGTEHVGRVAQRWTAPPCGAVMATWDGTSANSNGSCTGSGCSCGGTGSYGLGWALPRLDEALSALLEDLHQRGMLSNTLVVVVGEFGRTPRIDNNQGIAGRSHWPACFSAVLAGAGIGGSVYGASDRIGAYVKDHPVPPQALGATIYHALGVPRETQVASRPITTGEPILELFR